MKLKLQHFAHLEICFYLVTFCAEINVLRFCPNTKGCVIVHGFALILEAIDGQIDVQIDVQFVTLLQMYIGTHTYTLSIHVTY